MKSLKVCFVGIGSIATRHIKNLSDICVNERIGLMVDVLRTKKADLPENISDIVVNVFYNIEDLPSDYDVIFITNPTQYHIDTLKALHNKARDFFIEKPLASYENMNEVLHIKYRNDSVYYVACPLRYTNVIQYLKQNVSVEDVISVRCISSSYLPEWRPGVDYRSTYSAKRVLGGGVSLDLIHEWDYIQYLFGLPETIFYASGKKSKLEVDTEDYAIYVAEYKDKMVELHLDYFGRESLRRIEIFTNSETIIADLIANKISYLHEGKIVELTEQRDDFQKKELSYFLQIIRNRNLKYNSIKDAYRTMNLTRGIV